MAGVVFVTLLTGGLHNGDAYTDNVVNWVTQLQCHGVPNSSILILVATSTRPDDHATVSGLGVRVRRVPVIYTPTGTFRAD
jgi:hypothetical protein